jgi:hypothetical protein
LKLPHMMHVLLWGRFPCPLVTPDMMRARRQNRRTHSGACHSSPNAQRTKYTAQRETSPGSCHATARSLPAVVRVPATHHPPRACWNTWNSAGLAPMHLQHGPSRYRAFSDCGHGVGLRALAPQLNTATPRLNSRSTRADMGWRLARCAEVSAVGTLRNAKTRPFGVLHEFSQGVTFRYKRSNSAKQGRPCYCGSLTSGQVHPPTSHTSACRPTQPANQSTQQHKHRQSTQPVSQSKAQRSICIWFPAGQWAPPQRIASRCRGGGALPPTLRATEGSVHCALGGWSQISMSAHPVGDDAPRNGRGPRSAYIQLRNESRRACSPPATPSSGPCTMHDARCRRVLSYAWAAQCQPAPMYLCHPCPCTCTMPIAPQYCSHSLSYILSQDWPHSPLALQA